MSPDRRPHRHPRPSRRLAVVLALPALLVAAAPAAADAPWSLPTSVDREESWVGTPAVAPDGAAVTLVGSDHGSSLFPVSPAGVPGPARRAPNVDGVAAAGDRLVLLRRASRRGPQGVSFGDFRARGLGRLHVLARRGETLGTPVVGRAGHVLVAAESGTAGDGGVSRAAYRYRLTWSAPAGRARWASRRIPGRGALLGVAVDRRGAATVLLQRPVGPAADATRYVVVARVLDLWNGRLGPERVLDRHPYERVSGSVSVDDRGGAVLAWGTQDGGEQVDAPYVVRAAFRRRGTTTFTRRVTLDPGATRNRPDASPWTAMTPQGRATVAWSQPVGPRTLDGMGPKVPRVAAATPDGRFAPTIQPLPQGSVGGAATVGETTLVSVTGTSTPFDPKTSNGEEPPATVAGVVVRRGAAPFGALESVASSTPGDAGWIRLGAGPAGAVAAWAGASAPGRSGLRWSVRPVG